MTAALYSAHVCPDDVFNSCDWAEADLALEVVQPVQKLHQYSQQPYDGVSRFKGPPMSKAEVLSHYGDRPGFLQKGITNPQEMLAAVKACNQTQPQQVPLFNFRGLAMHDQDAADGDNAFEVSLGGFVLMRLEGPDGVQCRPGRVEDVFMNVAGERLVRVHWAFLLSDTPMEEYAAYFSGSGAAAAAAVTELPESLRQLHHPGRLWLARNEAVSNCYITCYPLQCIDKPCRVDYVPPGLQHPSSDHSCESGQPRFNLRHDFSYSQVFDPPFSTHEDV
ncbi:hypothetical protein OEZ85_010103 [Tetradesmus obliquus]|uniref:BAH domain-containing protein n=1 Tax=Tetradesmus obliquus TaxID=3088 RepID=A0ABY8TLV0_TETOB|nr:hypothetical protein OEZ85_010103 [Tetradesmus obliquus]